MPKLVTDIQGHLRTDVGSYHWLAFDSVSNHGLFVSYDFCRKCRPREIKVARLTVVGRGGPVATLGPGSDEMTVGSGDGTLNVIAYDGTVRRTRDPTAALTRGHDIGSVSWAPDGSRLAVLTRRGPQGSDNWLVEGDDTPKLAYSSNNPWILRLAWSPDGQSLLFDSLLPDGEAGWNRSAGADVVVLHRSSVNSSPVMWAQARYRSNRGFDWAGNVAWSPDGTRIAVRTRNHITEISAKDGSVIAQHPDIGGWLIWLARKD